ncbi:MAG TPA: hypothetical protein VGN37_22985 [Actinocatenispora sp.]
MTDAESPVAGAESPVADAEPPAADREQPVPDTADAEPPVTDPGHGVPDPVAAEPEAAGALFALPAVETDPPDRPVRSRRRRAAPAQASLFSAVLADPRPTDVAGVLAGAGQVVRMGGTARVSVVVAAEWRAGALLAAFDERGLSGSRVPTVDDNIGVRTAFCAALAPIADAWLHGTVTRPPVDFRADGLALRLWALSGGRRDSLGYLLPLPAAESAWQPLRLALRVAGFEADLLSSGPALRLVGRAQLTTLTDVLGPPPSGAPADAWPT